MYIVASFLSVVSFVNMCDNIFHSQLKHSETAKARDTYKQYIQDLEARCCNDFAYAEYITAIVDRNDKMFVDGLHGRQGRQLGCYKFAIQPLDQPAVIITFQANIRVLLPYATDLFNSEGRRDLNNLTH